MTLQDCLELGKECGLTTLDKLWLDFDQVEMFTGFLDEVNEYMLEHWEPI